MRDFVISYHEGQNGLGDPGAEPSTGSREVGGRPDRRATVRAARTPPQPHPTTPATAHPSGQPAPHRYQRASGTPICRERVRGLNSDTEVKRNSMPVIVRPGPALPPMSATIE